MTEARVLTSDEVREIRRDLEKSKLDGAADCTTEECVELCDSHEVLRKRLPSGAVESEILRLIEHTKDKGQSMDTAGWRKAVRAGLALSLLVLDGNTLEDILTSHRTLLEG